MIEFANASIADFEDLDSILNDGQCHVFADRKLPQGCHPDHATVGFEKNGDVYSVYISENISTSVNDSSFCLFLEHAEAKFVGLDDLVVFFRSLIPLFSDDYKEEKNVADEMPVVDRQKLARIQSEKEEEPSVSPKEIAALIKAEIYGQDEAIDALAEGIVLNRIRRDRAYVAMFMGPPATGKTGTATILAKALTKLYGKEYGFIKVDANVYRQEHMVQSILGAPPSYVGYGKGTVFDPVRKNPYHVILIDEIDKANESLLISMMEALDTGSLAMADNSPAIEMTRCIILFTSNIPIDVKVYEKCSEWERSEMCKNVFTSYCGRPEISRRIQDIMVFRPLPEEAQVDVIIKFAKQSLETFGAKLVHIDESLIADLLHHKTEYGSSEIADRVNKVIGRAILKSQDYKLIDKKSVSLVGTLDDLNFKIVNDEGGAR